MTNVVQYDSNFNLSIGTSPSSSFNSSGSIVAASGFTGSLSGSVFGLGDTVSFSSSVSSDLINLEIKSASVDISISSINTFTASNANTSLNLLTGSLATTGSNTFYGTQVFSGSVFIATDLIVQGSSSIQYISASSVSIGTNIVQLNTATPSVRYAGISVQDSGSSAGVTGSILWDSLCNKWIYSNPSGVGYSGGMLISGPRSSTLGDEVGLTCNYLAISVGSDHISSSAIYHTPTTTCVPNTLKIGVDTTITTRNITLGGYPTSICFGNAQSIYDNGGGGLTISSQADIQLTTSGSQSFNINSSGHVGIGTTTPCRELHVRGEILFQSRNATPTNNSMYRFIPRSTNSAFEFQLMSDNAACETTIWSVCRNAQTVTSFNILNGNVGIGTCAPTDKFVVSNGGANTLHFDVEFSGGASTIYSYNRSTSAYTDLNIQANNTIFKQGSTERLRIGSAGTFGFNCSGVAARTMVVKGVTGCYIVAEFIEPAGVHSIEIYPNKSSTNHISSDYMSGGTFLPLTLSGRENVNDLVLGTNGRVGIGNGANCGILTIYDSGCTITGGDVRFGCQAKGIEIFNANSGTTDNVVGLWISTGPHKVGIASGRTNAASSWEVDLRFYTHPTTIANLDNTYENMRLYGGGNLTINGTLAQTGGLSDINQKENLAKISNALNKIKCINGYNFDWKDGSPYNGDMLKIVSDAGLIAQEVEEIMPDIVRETKWDCHKTLNYNGVIALLVEGMKEQQCTIDLLKSCTGIL